MILSSDWMAKLQKEYSFLVPQESIPIFDLNHCLSSSIKEMRATGVSHIEATSFVIWSYSCSGNVSKISNDLSALILLDSFLGLVFI
jgi:hypothetical protein